VIETAPDEISVSDSPLKDEIVAGISNIGSAIRIGRISEFIPGDPHVSQDEKNGSKLYPVRSIAGQNSWRFEAMPSSDLVKGEISSASIPITLVPYSAAAAVFELPARKRRGRPTWKDPAALILAAAPLIRRRIEEQRMQGKIPAQVSYKLIAQGIGAGRISWHSVRKLHAKGSGEVRKAIDGIYRDVPDLIREAVRMIGKEIKRARKDGQIYKAVNIPMIAARIGKDNISVNAVYWAYSHGPKDVRAKIDSIRRDNGTLILEAIALLGEERMRVTETSIAWKTGLHLSCIHREKKLHPELEKRIGAAKEASKVRPKISRPVSSLGSSKFKLEDSRKTISTTPGSIL